MKTIDIISSKSDVHRWIIGRTLAKITGGQVPEVFYCNNSSDIKATEKCGENLLGACFDKREKTTTLPCSESGSTLRFSLPIVSALGLNGEFILEGSLVGRPIESLIEQLELNGARISSCNSNSNCQERLFVSGKLKPGNFSLPGNVSSQFASGLLMALPLLDGPSTLWIQEPVESEKYVDMTLKMLRGFSVEIEERENTADRVFSIKGNQAYSRGETYKAEGDWSNGAFFLTAGIIGEEPVYVRGLNSHSSQADREIVDIIKRFGGTIEEAEDGVTAYPSILKGIEIDVSQTPDLVPVLALLGVHAEGETRIVNAGRLRYKESDRLKSIANVIDSLGGDIQETDDGLIIKGRRNGKSGNLVAGHPNCENSSCSKPLKGGTISSHGDHRIAMMGEVASLISENPVIIEGKESVNKSYPEFYNLFEKLR